MSQLTANMQALGLEMPSMAYILGAIVFGMLGLWAYYRGKHTGKPIVRWLGVALMLYPYAVDATWLLYLLGIGLTAAIVWADQQDQP
jgi:hypothetical protein